MLRTISYENATNGLPPRTALPSSNLSSPPTTASSLNANNLTRPSSTPSTDTRSQAPRLLADIKRDSGVASSFATTEQSSHTTTNAQNSSLPSIVVQDGQSTEDTGMSRARLGHVGIQSHSSKGSLDDWDLGDLATDRIAFSQRGSLLYSGKKMNKKALSERQAIPATDGMVQSSAKTPTTSLRLDNTQKQEDGQSPAPPSPRSEERPEQGVPRPLASPGLVAATTPESSSSQPPASPSARRRPSGKMLQAALQNGRVLSVEELTFSKRVRNMYEYGDERAAEWSSPASFATNEKDQAEGIATDNSTPEPPSNNIVIGKTRQTQSDMRSPPRSPSSNVFANIHIEPNELAGGIEDWDNVDGRDVDRYGFIKHKRISSRGSTGDYEGIQRVATRLKVEADRPRKGHGLRRNPSATSRVSRTPAADGAGRPPSSYSTQTHRSIGNVSSSNPFRSKDKRALAEASDMLTLPPGLAQIAEQPARGKGRSTLNERERAREEKWQKMARVNQPRKKSTGEGGGMSFEFDTNDQKLVGRTWKGIPDRWRASAWHSFLSTSAKKRGIAASDGELMTLFHKLQIESSADDVQIDMDVPRTINMHVMFRRRYRGGQRLLFRVLHAISLYFPDTGYVQGMASLAATLLCYFDEETAFIMMVRLWQLRGLEQLFQSGFGGLMKALEEFEKDWLKHGDVAKKLDDLGISSTAYGTRWYLTLFNMSIPFPAQLRVWDVFMLLGDASNRENDFGGADLDVLHATSAALIDATREILLDSDFENAMKVLTSFVPIRDEDLLMRVAKAEWKQRKKRGVKGST